MSIINYWGKTGENSSYHPLPYHCLDVAAVGNALIDANPALLVNISKKLKFSPEKCRFWLLFFLAFHDIGKFSTSFQNQKPELLKLLQEQKSNKRYPKRHDSLGYFCWDRHVRKKFISRLFGEVLAGKSQLRTWFSLWAKWSTGHHGIPPEEECLDLFNYFRQEDLDAVDEFTDQLTLLFKFEISNHAFTDLPDNASLKQLSWFMAGLVTLCDWIGSNAEYFPLNSNELPLDEYWKQACQRAENAIYAVGIIPATVAPSSSLFTLFPQYVSSATPLQTYCDRIELPDDPQLWILEDVTGAGKTEAALTLAGRMMSKGLGQGCFIALPTMATSNAMYNRMGEVYSKLFKAGEKPSLLLAHGSRHLSEKFQQSFLDLDANKITDNGEKELSIAAQCSRWLADSSKKALLADVGVGTVDQVLLGILPARHQSLRLLGLQNKILIVDEVHSYDPYMNRLLENCLEFHAAAGGSAILLSATLPQGMRERLCNAYRKGLGFEDFAPLKCNQYPLVTMISAQPNASEHEVETRSSVNRSVAISVIDEICDVYTLIKEEIAKGHCVCWIRNTVHDVRSGYSDLLEQGICKTEELMMFHSRFTLRDRLSIEDRVVKRFGSSSTVEDRNGQVLIASQVVEQSLDLDFDIMISDLAPIDLLIQRAGRLQRHERNEPRDAPVLYLYGPTPNKEPKKDWYKGTFPKACYVYPDTSNLWRTQQLLLQKGGISMPEGARDLIEGVYGEKAVDVPEELLFSEGDYWVKEMSDRSMASFNGLIMEKGFVRESSPHWDEETRIPTRLGDTQINLYLARIINGKVEPFYRGNFAWDQSKLKIREGLLETLDLAHSDEKILAAFRDESALFHKSDLILPVSKVGNKWVARGYDKHENEMVVEYDCKQGLTIEPYQQEEE